MTPRTPGPVRLGFIGCGNVLGAYLAVAEKLQREGSAEVVALCGREKHRARARELGVPGFHTDYRELLARPDVDAVVILTPAGEHAAMARAALRAGKHVVLEKPLGTSLAQARAVVRESRAARRLLICAPFTVLSPTFQAVATRLRRGDLGEIVAARARYGWAGPDWSEWFYRPGGGALFDLGVYNLTTLTGWLGPARRVTAMAGIAIPRRVVRGQTIRVAAEDIAQVTLQFGETTFATVLAGFTLQQYHGPGVELFGTEGTLYLHGDDWDPDGYEIWQNSAGCWQRFKETHPGWPWADGLRHLVECVRHEIPPRVTPEHALHVLEIMVEAQAAARDGRARRLKSTFEPPAAPDPEKSSSAHRVHDRTRHETDE